jgi:EAL and modified HD-GYP domain-containing signal transduction protein
MLDVLVGMPMEEILYEMPLAPPIARALISEEGELGAALRCARAYERGWWHKVSYCGLAPDVIRAAYVDSVFWAEEARAMMS